MARTYKLTVIVAGLLSAGLAGAVYAQQSAEELVGKRRAEMIIIGRANGGIGAAVRGGATPSAEVLTVMKGEAAKMVTAFHAVKDPALWAKGSGVADGVAGTKAKAEIWSDEAGFKASMEASIAAAEALKAAVDAGNADDIRAKQQAAQATCGACHSKYRI